MMKKQISLLVCGLVMGLVSCSEKQGANAPEQQATEQASGLQSLLLDSMPEGAISINVLRNSAKVGDVVAFSGKLIGGDPVLIEKRAIMTLGDPSKLTSCDLKEDDGCPTPWDVCCDDFETVKENIVTVQAVDEAGVPIKEGFRGLGGIQELSKVVVLGVVAEGSNNDNMVVNLTGIYLEKDS